MIFELVEKKRITEEYKEDLLLAPEYKKEPLMAARKLVNDYAGHAQDRADYMESMSDERRTAKIIKARIDALLKEMRQLVRHVDSDILDCFASKAADRRPASDMLFPEKPEFRPSKAQKCLPKTRKAMLAAIRKLSTFRKLLHFKQYANDGRTDHQFSQFLKSMAEVWEELTGKMPGRTGSGVFVNFVHAAWITVGLPDEPDLADRIASYVRRGVHSG